MDNIPGRLRFPTADEMGGAVRDGFAIVAFSARSRNDLLFLKLATHASGAATVSLDPIVAQWLYTALGDFLRIGTDSPEAQAKWHDGEFTDTQGKVGGE
jgi:hypothetical protein